MKPANRLPLVKQAMRLLVEKLGENDRVAIVVYAGASGLALPSTTGDRKEQILAALENLAGRRLDQRRARELSSPTRRRRNISSRAASTGSSSRPTAISTSGRRAKATSSG